MPVAISCWGIVLLYGSIVITAIDNSLGPFYYKASIGYLTFETINYGTHGFYLLGVAMIFLGLIVAYKPHIYIHETGQSQQSNLDKISRLG